MMAMKRLALFLVMVVYWMEINGENTCFSGDINAVMVRLRQFTTSTHDTVTAMQGQITELQKQTQQQNTKMGELEKNNSRLETEIQESQSEIGKLKEKNLNLENIVRNLSLENQQQNTKIESLRFGNSTGKVAFIARKPSNVDPPNGLILVFTTVELDTQSCYDSSTGKFTARVAGTYLFSVQMCIRKESGIDYVIKSSKATNNVHAAVFHGGNYMDRECSSVTTVIILGKSESVWVESGTTYGNSKEIFLSENAWNMFLGTLLV